MTAQAIAPLPPDPTPPAGRAQDPASGQQFMAMLGPTRNAGNDAAKSTTAAPDASSGTSGAASTPAKKAPSDADGASSTGDGGDSPPATSNRKTSDDNAANATAAVVPLPLPIPLPAPPSAAAATPATSAPAVPSTPPPAPNAAGNAANLAALLANNVANPQGATAPTPPAASAIASALARTTNAAAKAAATSAAAPIVNGAGGNGAQSPSSTNAASKSAAPASQAGPASASTVPLPSIAAQLGARMAAAAPTLTSQPGAALASLAHEAQKAAQEKTPALDGSAASGGHAVTALDALSAATKPAMASPGDKFLASLAKNDAAAPTHGDDTAAATTAQATDPANAANANPPPAAPMTLATASNGPALSPELPLATPLLLPHTVAEQVALNLRQAAKDGSDHIQIQLQPADLGTIDVKLNVSHEGRVMVVVSADRSDTLNLLQQDASNLAQALRDAGLQADNSSLSFNLRGGYQFNQQQAMSGGASYAGVADSGPDEAEAILPLASARRAHSGSLDIHV